MCIYSDSKFLLNINDINHCFYLEPMVSFTLLWTTQWLWSAFWVWQKYRFGYNFLCELFKKSWGHTVEENLEIPIPTQVNRYRWSCNSVLHGGYLHFLLCFLKKFLRYSLSLLLLMILCYWWLILVIILYYAIDVIDC